MEEGAHGGVAGRVRVRKMAVNRDHVPGLLIKASLDLHFVDISLPFRLNNNEAKPEAEEHNFGASLISRTVQLSSLIRFPYRNIDKSHVQLKKGKQKKKTSPSNKNKNKELAKGKLNNNKMAFVASVLGLGHTDTRSCQLAVTHTGKHTHSRLCQRQQFCNLSLHKYIHSPICLPGQTEPGRLCSNWNEL